MGKTEIIHKHENTPDYEVKILLVALRKVNDISELEMAKFIGIPKNLLVEYERDSIVKKEYTAKYIEALEEYISYAPKRGRSFFEAIRIYKKQKCLHRYPISYKLALFGNIFYGSTYVELKSFDKNDLNKDMENDNSASEEIIIFDEQEKDSVWSREKYEIAFCILKTIRNLLDINLEEACQNLLISQSTLRIIENKFAYYSGKRDIRRLVKEYSIYLDKILTKRGINNKVYDIICECLIEDIGRQDKLKMIEALIQKLYKEKT